jgi:predicted HTH domain antitoxin
MEESAKHRRVELIEEIRRHRKRLHILGRALERADRSPNQVREDVAIHKREIAERLRLFEEELHELNVQLIREGLSENAG